MLRRWLIHWVPTQILHQMSARRSLLVSESRLPVIKGQNLLNVTLEGGSCSAILGLLTETGANRGQVGDRGFG